MVTESEIERLISGLDLDKDQTIDFLNKCHWRVRDKGGVEVFWINKWLHLCRTDLKDDVRTWTQESSRGNPNDIIFYRGSVMYGARITGEAFYIVDSTTDG